MVFFAAKHTINLISGEKLEIATRKELEDVIAKEKDAILKDKELRKKFDEIAKLLEKNATLREFQAYLLEKRSSYIATNQHQAIQGGYLEVISKSAL